MLFSVLAAKLDLRESSYPVTRLYGSLPDTATNELVRASVSLNTVVLPHNILTVSRGSQSVNSP